VNTCRPSGRVPALHVLYLAALAAVLGQGCSGEEIYRHGGSTAIIRQSGAGHAGAVRVSCYHDGQRIVSRHGGSTDITLQSGERAPASATVPCARWHDGQRFPSDAALSGPGGSAADDAFRERMRARMEQRFAP